MLGQKDFMASSSCPVDRQVVLSCPRCKEKNYISYFLLYILLMNMNVSQIQFNSQGQVIVTPPGEY